MSTRLCESAIPSGASPQGLANPAYYVRCLPFPADGDVAVPDTGVFGDFSKVGAPHAHGVHGDQFVDRVARGNVDERRHPDAVTVSGRPDASYV